MFLALYDKKISHKEFEKFHDVTTYNRGESDVKRNHALEALTKAVPQTHTHGDKINYVTL